MMFKTLHILLLLTAAAMVQERVTAACLKYKLRLFQNTYNLMQSLKSVGCCDTKVTKYNKWGQLIIRDGYLLSNHQQAGANVCKGIDNCDHTFLVTHQVVNGTTWSSDWAGTRLRGMVFFGNSIGDINNGGLKACSELKIREQNFTTWGKRRHYIMPDVDLTIMINDVDTSRVWNIAGHQNNFVTYFKARIHSMRFASGKKRLCLYANFRVPNVRLTFEPEKGCPQAPFWMAIDFELEFTEEEKRRSDNRFHNHFILPDLVEAIRGPYCSIVHDNQTFGCMLDPCTGCNGILEPCTNDENGCCVNNSCYHNRNKGKIQTRQ